MRRVITAADIEDIEDTEEREAKDWTRRSWKQRHERLTQIAA